MQLVTGRLILRDFCESDYPALREIESLPETHRFEKVSIPTEEKTRAVLRRWVAQASKQPRTQFNLALTIPPADRARGCIKLIRLHSEIREWEIGWVVHKNDWGKGYAVEAAREMLRLAFTELGVHRVVAFCNALNVASYRVMEKLGMQRDGLLRQSLWWNEQWVDECVYAILERDWQQQK